MILYNDLLQYNTKLSVIGLGYVGLPIAIAFSKSVDVVGYDANEAKIDLYRQGIDPTKEVGDAEVKSCSVDFTSDATTLQQATFHIVAVPTPVNEDHTPNLEPIKSASKTLGKNLTAGSIVVYESTVYPGLTEEICVPILEKESGLKCGVDFKVGYSPERINPGDKTHRLENITKIVSGKDAEALDIIANVYELVVDAGVYRAESIKVAEAAKVIENSQRDINIAFMNELSIIFNKMGIDTKSVLEAAGTKWNFLKFQPGLVGGHCIGVDPYYLTHKAEELGYESQVILAGRKINDSMGKYVADETAKILSKQGKTLNECKVAILGLTFKENCPDVRNTKVVDIINELKDYGIEVVVSDYQADKDEAKRLYGIEFAELSDIINVDAVVVAVAHQDYVNLEPSQLNNRFKNDKVIIDVKSILDKTKYENAGYTYWRL